MFDPRPEFNLLADNLLIELESTSCKLDPKELDDKFCIEYVNSLLRNTSLQKVRILGGSIRTRGVLTAHETMAALIGGPVYIPASLPHSLRPTHTYRSPGM